MAVRKVAVLCLVCLVGLSAPALHAADAAPAVKWNASIEKAQAAAKESGKLIFAVFTGSGREGIPAQMETEILATPEFQKWADTVVLLKIDFPKDHTLLTKEEKTARVALAKHYSITGLPSIRIINADGERVGQHRYVAGGPAAWIPTANNALAAATFPGKPWLAPTIADGMKLAKSSGRKLVLVLSDNAEGLAQFKDKLTANKILAERNVVLVSVDLTAKEIDPGFKALGAKAGSNWIVIDPAKKDEPLAAILRNMTDVLPDALLEALPEAFAWFRDDFDGALAKAKASGLPLLVDFTGSDWCGWCIRLDEEVFDTPEFEEWAKGKVVLLKLDYPKRKPQSAEIKARNAELQKKYGIRGFPTILLLDGNGNKFGKLGYAKGGPETWCGLADKALEKASK